MFVLVFQALRYSYFHVGQALGTPQQILEQGRPQPAILPPRGPLQTQQQPLLLQPVPPSQPPPPNQHCPPSRPLQQIQPSSTAAQAAVYQRHGDVVREQQPKHTLKQEQSAAGPPQNLLPYIDDKSLQNKVSMVQPFVRLRWKTLRATSLFRNICNYFMTTALNSHILYSPLKNVTCVCNNWVGSYMYGVFFF